MRKPNLSTILIVLLVMGIGIFYYKRYRVPPKVDIPALALIDLNGNKVSLRSYSGQPLFISFFATWCGPCIKELPEIAKLKDKLADKKLEVLCISDEPIERLQRLQTTIGNRLLILHSETSLHEIGIYTFPTNYIYDATGKKVYDQVNPDQWTDSVTINRIKILLD